MSLRHVPSPSPSPSQLFVYGEILRFCLKHNFGFKLCLYTIPSQSFGVPNTPLAIDVFRIKEGDGEGDDDGANNLKPGIITTKV